MGQTFRRTTAAVFAVALIAAGVRQVVRAQAPTGARGGPPGYLTRAEIQDVVRVLPPPPVAGDARELADRAIFHATRSLEGSPRWALAQRDNVLSAAALLADFQCSAGLVLDAQRTPRTAALIARVARDSVASMTPSKQQNPRPRPYQIAEGPVCIATGSLDNSPDYPSGHTLEGWAIGMVLAELMPDRADHILARALAFGQSRVVCGVHNASAIEGGRIVADALVARLHSSPAFRADQDAARTELSLALGRDGLDARACTEETAALAKPPY